MRMHGSTLMKVVMRVRYARGVIAGAALEWNRVRGLDSVRVSLCSMSLSSIAAVEHVNKR